MCRGNPLVGNTVMKEKPCSSLWDSHVACAPRNDSVFLSLSLLMLGVLADHHDFTVSLDDLALLTHFLY